MLKNELSEHKCYLNPCQPTPRIYFSSNNDTLYKHQHPAHNNENNVLMKMIKGFLLVFI